MSPEIDNWWSLALDDLDTAQKNVGIGKYHVAALFAQQAAEKALKALYIKRFNELRKTHDLVFLAGKLGIPNSYLTICKQLDPVYLQTRYPDISGRLPQSMFNKADAEELVKISGEILQWVKKNLF